MKEKKPRRPGSLKYVSKLNLAGLTLDSGFFTFYLAFLDTYSKYVPIFGVIQIAFKEKLVTFLCTLLIKNIHMTIFGLQAWLDKTMSRQSAKYAFRFVF